MLSTAHVSPDEIRKGFSKAMSDMYRDEVPLYGALMALVAETNTRVLEAQPDLAQQLQRTGEIQRLDMERHGAIRLGTAFELATIGRLFAVMGMQPVGYYDLAPAGVPVHSTAFRATHEASLQASHSFPSCRACVPKVKLPRQCDDKHDEGPASFPCSEAPSGNMRECP